MRTRRAAGTALLLLTCASTAAARQATEPLVLSSDPELRAMAERLLPDLAERAGLERREPVRLVRRSRADLVRSLEAKLDEQLPEEAARDVV
ncbi:MAG TPA: hypothetical protein VFQ22_12335, partial [Longimicrobiales bacterium]|nr:hypothetical protein [Longimicrobiales bacterium]